ncbi:P-type conjugative transfer protein TrbL [Vulcaniibacterium tengchongense]|uniref:P-type conjugative transfer protein TrbL n=1 Tax=Vulcaniibacterium tengchongense TaxID=1273429 RepID=UPI0024117A6B|nr:P-type conjugative transfer protein TrbL [Vulcaniibacterium tengchongense]
MNEPGTRPSTALGTPTVCLFGLLSIISLALFLYRQALTGEGNLPAFVAKFTLEILKFGFFLWLVNAGPAFVMQFVGYFTDAGARIGQAGTLSASGVVILGFDSCFRIFDAIGAMGWGETAAFGLPLALVAIAILVCFAAVGVLFLIRVIELHLIVYGGVLLLGFGGISFTRDIPKNYLAYAISAGTQLFMLYVIVGLGVQLAESWPQALTVENGAGDILRQALQIMVGAAVFAALAWSIPKVAASLVSGSISLGAADVLGPAAAAAGGAAAGATVATGGVSAAVGSLAAATKGAVQATSAGTALAKEQGASGSMAAIKGLGHAASALRTEAGSSMKAKVGLSPPSPNAHDARGRDVSNIGTRAANRLSDTLQATREERTAGSGTGDRDAGHAVEQTAVSPEASHEAPARPASSLESADISRPVAGVADVRPRPLFESKANDGPKGGAPIRAPQIPQDTAPSSTVSIRFDPED